MAYALIVFPWAEVETDKIRVRAIAEWGGWKWVERERGAEAYVQAPFVSAMLLSPLRS